MRALLANLGRACIVIVFGAGLGLAISAALALAGTLGGG